MQSAMYTLKYIIQPKQRAVFGIEKTRAQFSKGLGLSYLTTAVYDYHTLDYDDPNFISVIDGNKVALPRYYKLKIFTKYQMRREAERNLKVKRQKTREQYAEVRRSGIFGPSPKRGKPRIEYMKKIKNYLLAIRTEQACRIIHKTKYGLTV